MLSLSINASIHFPSQLLSASGIPAGLTARFYDEALAGEREIGSFAAIERESFTTTVALPDSRSTNLVVRLFDSSGKPLAESAPQYGVRGEASVVLDYPDPLAGLPEYDRVAATLAPYLRGRAISALSGTERARLAAMTGFDRNLVDRLLAATRGAQTLEHLMHLSGDASTGTTTSAPAALTAGRSAAVHQSTSVSPRASSDMVPVFYALIHAFGDVPLGQLISHSRASLQRTLERAGNDKVISVLASSALPGILATLASARDALLLNLKDDSLPGEAKVISWVPLPPELRSRLLDRVLDIVRPQAALDAADFLTSAQRVLLTQAFALFQALGRYSPMLGALTKRSGEGARLLSVENGLDRDRLHRMTEADWLARIQAIKAEGEVGFPVSYRNKSQPEATYAKDIVAGIARQDPAGNVAAHLAASSIQGGAELAALLRAHPEFDIRTTSARRFFRAPGESGATARAAEPQVAKLEAVQRMLKLAPDGRIPVVEALLDNGYTSAFDILREGKGTFTAKLSSRLDGTTAAGVYANAKRTFASVYATAVGLKQSGADLRVLREANPADVPNLTTLFGNADFCACEQCQSVYGPAAYLTDLLYWMESDIGSSPNNDALSELKRRRPDIPNILLNCHNTNTELPYTDLVNEILSYALLTGINQPNLGALQTGGETEDLLLQAEHRFAAAEQLLKGASFTWRLPYDADWDAARAYLEAFGWAQPALVWALSPEDWIRRNALEKQTWSAAFLGLVPEEFVIVTASNAAAPHFWKEFFGLASAPGSAVSPLLDTCELEDLATLETLLKTEYVRSSADSGPAFPFENIAFPANAPCDVDQAFLAGNGGQPLAFGPGPADRLMRFERLRRRANISISELDGALKNFAGLHLDANFTVRLAAALSIAQRLNRTSSEVLSWWPATADTRDAYTKALGLAPKEYTAATALLAYDPLLGVEPALRFVIDIDRLRGLSLLPSQLYDLLAGAGKWELVSDRARDPAFAAEARAAWTAMEASIAPIVAPDANGIGVIESGGSIPDPQHFYLTPAEAAAAKRLNQYRSALHLALANAVALSPTNVSKLVETYIWPIPPEGGNGQSINQTSQTERQSQSDTGLEPSTGAVTGVVWRIRFSTPRSSTTTAGQGAVARDWHVADPAVDIEALFTPMYRYLVRVARSAKAAGLDQDALAYIIDSNSISDLLQIRNLLVLAHAVTQARLLGVTQAAYLAQASAAGFAAGASMAATIVGRMSNVPSDMGPFVAWLTNEMAETSILAGQSNLLELAGLARDFGAIAGVPEFTARMIALAQIARDLGLPLQQVIALVWTDPSTPGGRAGNRLNNAQAQDLRAALRTQAGSKIAWSRVIVPVQNGLRARLRDALVAYYLGQQPANVQPPVSDVDALYRWFLIDPEMQSCMKTSRIVLAISSAQLLIERALLGLEPNLSLDGDNRQQWQWRKNYRVWEANRKVFFYPENWMDISLRATRSPFFAEAQQELLQDEVNAANVQNVFNNYLSKLLDVARLDIRALYIEDEGQGQDQQRTLHVFGRTWNPPYTYYYRRRDTHGRWSAWEKLDIDIEGDHLIPVILNGRLYLFWPVFAEKQSFQLSTGERRIEVEIRLCCSRQEFGKWSAKKQLEAVAKGMVEGDVSDLLFWAESQADGGASIHIRTPELAIAQTARYHSMSQFPSTGSALEFLVVGCNDQAMVTTVDRLQEGVEQHLVGHPPFTKLVGQQFVPEMDVNTAITVRHSTAEIYLTPEEQGLSFFVETPYRPFRITYSHQYKHTLDDKPFFFSDLRYTHFVDYIESSGPQHRVFLHEHPYCCSMLTSVNRFGVEGLLAPREDTQGISSLRRQQASKEYFLNDYSPNELNSGAPVQIQLPYPIESFDFGRSAAYAIYNWEIFFHLPALIAHELRLDGKYEEALRWLGFIFDPTNRDDIHDTSRFWMVKPFHEHVSPGSLAALLNLLSGSDLTPEQVDKRNQLVAQIEYWREHPFDPHAIADLRIETYMRWTVMEYIDSLIDWGDSLFRQFTAESVNEATHLYILASEILGRRPRKVKGAAPQERSFAQLPVVLGQFSDPMTAIETSQSGVTGSGTSSAQSQLGEAIDPTPSVLYFCVPENPQLLAYWDRVESRLFNIRHCRDIDGNPRDLPLFAPPIDPALLVAAQAAGLDLSDVLDDLYAPNPRYRFNYLMARAMDFSNEVKSLGAQLFVTLEKRDAEALAGLRQVHEQNLLRASRNLKKMQIDEAQQALAAAQSGRNMAQIRLDDYTARQFMNSEEASAKVLTEAAHDLQLGEQASMLLASELAPINFSTGLDGLNPTWALHVDMGMIPRIQGQATGALASALLNTANRALTSASYARRQEEWNLQRNLAQEEIRQAEKQIAAAEIRLAIAQKDLDTHDLQVDQSRTVLDWMRSKFSNRELYEWMTGELKGLHRKAYQLAFDLARQVQKAFALELGRSEQYIEYGHWDSARHGLLAGERLTMQLRELDAAYMRGNERKYEIVRSISLRLLNPDALMTLRAKKTAEFELPDWLFQLEFPNIKLYAMQIKGVAVSLPCVIGPYGSANLKLRLLKHKIGWTPGPLPSDWQFADPATNEIVTSSAVNDHGLFETHLHDERYWPFENVGVVSGWQVSLPTVPEFDYQTISDLVLHVRFTARGESVTPAAAEPQGPAGALLLSWRHDFPDNWRQVGAQIEAAGGASIAVPMPDIGMLPYKLRANQRTQPAPNSMWVVYRDAQGNRKLSAEVNATAFSVQVTSSANGMLLVGNGDSHPTFTYGAPDAANFAVDDILVAYVIT